MVGVIGLSNIIDIQTVIEQQAEPYMGTCQVQGSNIISLPIGPYKSEGIIYAVPADSEGSASFVNEYCGFIFFTYYTINIIQYVNGRYYYTMYPYKSWYSITVNETDITINWRGDGIFNTNLTYRFIIWK